MAEPIFLNPNWYDNIKLILNELKKYWVLVKKDNGRMLGAMDLRM